MNASPKTFFFTLIFCLLLTAYCSLSRASLSPQESSDALLAAQNAVGRDVGDYILTDQDGKEFRLQEFKGKPFIISLIYTECGYICPTITMNLKNAIQQAGKDFGGVFHAVTIGFDVEHDTAQRMKEYGKNFTDDFKNWRFAAADKETMKRLTKNLGFYYKKVNGGFDHLNVVTIIDAKGTIHKHVYGIDVKPEDILDPVYQSLQQSGGYKRPSQFGTTGIIGRIILFCYKYDEATGQYKLDYPFLIGTLLEAITIVTIIVLVWKRNIQSLFSRLFSRTVDREMKANVKKG